MKDQYLSKSQSKSRTQSMSFAGEIFEISPLVWFVLSIVAIGVFITGKLDVWKPLSDTVELWTLSTKTDLYKFSNNWQNLIGNLGNIPQNQQKMSQLSDKVLVLESRLAQVESVFSENEKLQNEVGIKYSRDYPMIGVEVVGVDQTHRGIIRINKGESDGLKLGDVAVVEKILLGKISKLNRYTAEVTLLDNQNSSLPVKLADKNLGILTATESGGLQVSKILQSTKVNIGDQVFSSGVNSDYPPDFYIGEVVSVSNDPRASIKDAVLLSPVEFEQLTKFKILQLPS